MTPISTTEAARLMQTTTPTVRRMLEAGELEGEKRASGSRFAWDIEPASVDQFLKVNGPINGKRPTHPSRLDVVEVELEKIREQIRGHAAAATESPDAASERDDLRADNVGLRDALGRTREALELQRRADDERSAQVDHLLEAAKAGERADGLRRRALEQLDEALAGFTQPGHVGQIGSRQG